ncbi:MAG: MATE family efflux transporter [Ignavibacteria bacterium RBG_13_36_8]|nr:MAG: MATE family efflux transporter [Ignavibacteria bacterium RBG_13_36_8]
MKLLPQKGSYRYILHMALPAIAGLSTQMVVSLVDTAMVGRLQNAEYSLAAMGLGVLATWALISFFSSLATGTHVLIARRFGAKEFDACGDVLNTSLVLSFFIGFVVGLSVVLTSYHIADFFAVDDRVGKYAGDYLHYRFIGIPFFLLTVSYRGFFFGIGKTKIFMYSGILANFLNVVFNYIFIFGAFGIKGMGLAGAGLGSTIATICDAVFYFSITLSPRYRRKFHYFKNFRFVKEYAGSIFKISLPVSFQNVFILIGFLSFVAITGLIGTSAQAASQVVIASLMITLMPCNGFGIATQTLVGNSLGAGKINRAKYFGYETSKLATIYTIFVGIVFTVFPRLILILITNDNQVIETAVPALRIAGFGQIFYGIGVVLANGLQAAGKTFFVMMADVIIIWFIFVPLSLVLGVILEFGLVGAWFALPFYIILYSIVMYTKFRFGNWKRLRNV